MSRAERAKVEFLRAQEGTENANSAISTLDSGAPFDISCTHRMSSSFEKESAKMLHVKSVFNHVRVPDISHA